MRFLDQYNVDKSAKPKKSTLQTDKVISVVSGVPLKVCYHKFMFWSLQEIRDFFRRGIYPEWWYRNPQDRGCGLEV